ncbi:MAG: acyltransferase family protein [Prevotella sp.]
MITSLQGWRFVFMMLIVVSHFFSPDFEAGGECGVSFFFMLSGFVLSYAYGDRITGKQFSTRTLYTRQLMKFYPLHLVVFAIMAALDFKGGIVYSWLQLVLQALLLQCWIPKAEYLFVANGSSWFLCDILFFYLVFSAIYRIIYSMRPKVLAAYSMFFLVGYFLLAALLPERYTNAVMYAFPPVRLMELCIGMVICRIYRNEVSRKIRNWVDVQHIWLITLIEMAILLLYVLCFGVYEQIGVNFHCASLFWAANILLLYWFALNDKGKGLLMRLLCHPLMGKGGTMALEIFLTHMLTIRLVHCILYRIGWDGNKDFCIISLTLCCVLAVAWLTKTFFVDKLYVLAKRYVLNS